MQDIITSYLLLNRQVALPGIGLLSMAPKSAEIDTPSDKILPPADEFIFTQDTSNTSHELVKYIARKKNISDAVAEDELEKFCRDWKQKIDSGNKLCFETVGCLQKIEEAIIFLKDDENVQYLQPLYAEIMHQETVPVLIEDSVKDKAIADDIPESVPLAHHEYYNNSTIAAKPAWLKWAIILFAVALVTLLFHYYGQRFSTVSAGNQSHFFVASPDSTHFTPEQ